LTFASRLRYDLFETLPTIVRSTADFTHASMTAASKEADPRPVAHYHDPQLNEFT